MCARPRCCCCICCLPAAPAAAAAAGPPPTLPMPGGGGNGRDAEASRIPVDMVSVDDRLRCGAAEAWLAPGCSAAACGRLPEDKLVCARPRCCCCICCISSWGGGLKNCTGTQPSLPVSNLAHARNGSLNSRTDSRSPFLNASPCRFGSPAQFPLPVWTLITGLPGTIADPRTGFGAALAKPTAPAVVDTIVDGALVRES